MCSSPAESVSAESSLFRILTVCTGNVCRSPLAAVLLRERLSGLPVEVRSAGTQALRGRPMTPETQHIASSHGVRDADAHTAHQLVPDDLREADLILAMSREHRRAIVEMLPRVSRRTFTIREFARLADALAQTSPAMAALPPPGPDTDAATARAALLAMVEQVAQTRGTLPPLADAADGDVVDPYRKGEEIYAASAAQLLPAVESTVTLVYRTVTVESYS